MPSSASACPLSLNGTIDIQEILADTIAVARRTSNLFRGYQAYSCGEFQQLSRDERDTFLTDLDPIYYTKQADRAVIERSIRRDQNCCLITYEMFENFPNFMNLLPVESEVSIEGNLRYEGHGRRARAVGAAILGYDGGSSGDYRYTIRRKPNGEIGLKVKVHFQNSEEFDELMERIEQAEMEFSRRFPTNRFGFSVSLDFEVVDDPSEADFSNIVLKRYPENARARGPYDQFWDISWNTHTLVHEFGHFLGLDDEYDFGSSNSIMANPWQGFSSHQYYHHYQILSRFFCQFNN